MTPLDGYEIGAACGMGLAVLVVTRGGRSKTIGPWKPRQAGAHWAVLEAVERATMLDMQDVSRTVYVAQDSVVKVCAREPQLDGFDGLRLRLAEGRFKVMHADPARRPHCLVAARAAVGGHE